MESLRQLNIKTLNVLGAGPRNPGRIIMIGRMGGGELWSLPGAWSVLAYFEKVLVDRNRIILTDIL